MSFHEHGLFTFLFGSELHLVRDKTTCRPDWCWSVIIRTWTWATDPHSHLHPHTSSHLSMDISASHIPHIGSHETRPFVNSHHSSDPHMKSRRFHGLKKFYNFYRPQTKFGKIIFSRASDGGRCVRAITYPFPQGMGPISYYIPLQLVLISSGGKWITYIWHAGGTHPTGMLSCVLSVHLIFLFTIWRELILPWRWCTVHK